MKSKYARIKEIANKKVDTVLGYGLIAGTFVLTLVIGLLCL